MNAVEQEKAEVPLLSNPLKGIESGADVFIGYLLFDAFFEAALINPKAALKWLNQLSNVRDIDMVDIMYRVPKSEISKESIDFAVAILKLNKKRLLELQGGLK
jgi:hypothetical protein